MEILLLLTDLKGAAGGIPTFNRALVRALEALLSDRPGAVRILALNDRWSPWIPATGGSFRYEGFGGRRWAFARAARRAARSADHVLLGHVHLAPLAWLMGRRSVSAVLHGIEAWPRLAWLRRWSLRRVSAFWCVSRYTQERFCQSNRIRPERCRYFPDTLVQPKLTDDHCLSRKALELPERGKMLLTVSRLCAQESYKRIEDVLRALPEVLRRVPDAYYVIVGEGSDRARLEALSVSLGLSERVVFKGSVPDGRLPSYYAASDAFVLPSTGEGFGIVFLEAMQYARACIGAQAGAVPEVIVDGETGLLVAPGDVPALAEAIGRVLSDPALRRRLGEAGQERFQSLFAPEHFKARLEKLAGLAALAGRREAA